MIHSLNSYAFGSKNGASSLRSYQPNQPLTIDQIRNVAPSVFAEQKHDSRSDRYTYIPTSEILSGLMKEGFQPFAVAQGGSRDEEKRGFTKHMIRLRHSDASAMIAKRRQAGQHTFIKDGPVFPEIVLLNSHDGTSSYRISAGMFRLACANGLIVSEACIADVRIHHKGDIQGEVIEGAFEIVERLPSALDSAAEMSALNLTDGERNAFATAALVARYDAPDAAPIKPEAILRVTRTEDAAPSLWNTMNVAQEHLIRGGDRYMQRGDFGRVTRRRTREVKGIDQNAHINRALWTLAEEMRKLKANA